MQIAIIGGGISGLSAYLNLQKNLAKDSRSKESVSITIYETYDLAHLGDTEPTDIPSHGGGYGIAPNGMASLRRLDPKIHDEIQQHGFASPKTWMKSARGWTLGVMAFNDVRGEHPECCTMVLRETVLRILYERVPRSAIVQRKVMQVSDGKNHARIKLDNGDEETYDLVIGADGVWSKTRNTLIGDTPSPEYKGLFTVGGFVPIECLPSPPETGPAAHSQTVMTFGPNGFFAYTPYTTGDVKVSEQHIRGEATLPPGKMAFWWSRSAQQDSKANPNELALKKELEERLSSWKDPTIEMILQNSEIRFKIPTFVLPKISKWAGKRIVLVGDSAHALPSSSGQGVSQSLEDTEALSLLLSHNLATSSDGIADSAILSKTFEQYVKVRKSHVEEVLDAGNKAGDTSRDMGLTKEFMMYGFMWIAFKLFSNLFSKAIVNYDVLAEVDKVKSEG